MTPRQALLLRRWMPITIGILVATVGIAWAAVPAGPDDAATLRQICEAAQRGQLSSADRTWAQRCARVAGVAGGQLTPTSTPTPTVTSPSPTPSPTASPSPTSSPTPGPTTPPPTTSPPSPSPSPTPSPTPTPPPPGGGCPAFPAFPDASCTGWEHTGVALHACSVPFGQIETNGATFDSCYFSSGLVIHADNVRITRSMIHGPVAPHWSSNYTMRGLVLTDVEIEQCTLTTAAGSIGCTIHNPNASSDVAALSGGDFTCTRCDIHNNVTGVHLGDRAKLIDSYVHDLDYFDGSHGAAAGMGLGTGYHSQIIHNNLDCARLAGQPGICSAALSIYDEPLVDDVFVQNNLLNTIIGYCAYGGDGGGTHIRFIGNRFGMKYNPQCGSHGPIAAFSPGNTGNQWTDNLFTDGRPVTV